MEDEAAARPEVPVLSVVVPCLVGDDELRQQLEALARQDHDGPWEVVLADNAGTGDVARLAATFVDRLPGLRVVDASARPGKPYAVNHAVTFTEGDVLVLLDSDDVVDEGYLRAVAEAARHHDVMGARLDASLLNPAWVQARRAPMQETGLEVLLDHRPVVVGAGLSVSREAFDAVGGFDEDMLRQQDIDLSWRLQEAGYECAFVPDAVVNYRYRADLGSIWRQERAYGAHEVLLYRKHRAAGAPRRRPRRMVKGWLDVLLALPRVRSEAGRARLVTTLGAALGRLSGSLRHHTLYL